MARIGIIIASTRPKRICKEIAEWTLRTARTGSDLDFELIDLAEINLPFLDEPEQPSDGNYVHEHTKFWSELISSFDGFIVVTPQYNWGYPAPLKNALDFLYYEWADKVFSVISYGAHGGNKSAAQLAIVLEGLHTRQTINNPQITLHRAMFNQDGKFKDVDTDFSAYDDDIKKVTDEISEILNSDPK